MTIKLKHNYNKLDNAVSWTDRIAGAAVFITAAYIIAISILH